MLCLYCSLYNFCGPNLHIYILKLFVNAGQHNDTFMAEDTVTKIITFVPWKKRKSSEFGTT